MFQVTVGVLGRSKRGRKDVCVAEIMINIRTRASHSRWFAASGWFSPPAYLVSTGSESSNDLFLVNNLRLFLRTDILLAST